MAGLGEAQAPSKFANGDSKFFGDFYGHIVG